MKHNFWKKIFLILWISFYILGILLFICKIGSKFFQYSIQSYLFLFAIAILFYIFKIIKNSNLKEKWDLVINEIILCFLFFFLSALFPSIMTFEPDSYTRSLYYFHMWDSLSVNFLCWYFYIYFAQKNNIKKHRVLKYPEWKELFLSIQENVDHSFHNLKRKLMHFLTPLGLILSYVLIQLSQKFITFSNPSSKSFLVFCWLVVFLHLLWVFTIADLLRLSKFEYLGRFATRWFENSLKNTELVKFTTAPILVATWIPFFINAPSTVFLIVCISTISDAVASIFGKKYPIKRFAFNQKSLGGYVAGIFTTIVSIIVTYFLFGFNFKPNLSIFSFIAIISLLYLLIDIISIKISDNFLNSAIIGITTLICVQF